MLVKEKIEKIRELMRKDNIDYYFLVTADPHLSEYIADYYKEREYLSGFTGSNGNLLITLTKAYLWTDGRYFVQAKEELEGSDIILMKMGQKDVPTVMEFIKSNVKENECFAFNGSLISAKAAGEIEEVLNIINAHINSKVDYVDMIWEDRPKDSSTSIYILEDKITGEKSISKLNRLREKLKELDVNGHFMSKLDDIMWLYNIRANDIECNPVCYAYSFVTIDKAYIFLKNESVSTELINYFNLLNVEVLSYYNLDILIKYIKKDMKILIDKSTCNYNIFNIIEKNSDVLIEASPVELFKAIKNQVEIQNSKYCYIKDSVALTQFIIWLKNHVINNRITETKAVEVLDDIRAKIPGFIELSFPTISAYGANAAKMHYEAIQGKDAVLKPEGIYLVDSGATYFNGTTDVTRSVILGPVTAEMKMHFTLAVVGMLRLQNAVFYKGATGRNLDILARMPLWEKGIDYKCGTGHGVGYILNVHEGPQSIRTLRRKGEEETAFEKGMIVSDEPGVYIEGSHGIRIENILLCEDYMSSDDGDFLCFEPLTLVPIDLDGIDINYLTDKDKEYLNNYHKLVYEKLSKYMSGQELESLKEMTRLI